MGYILCLPYTQRRVIGIDLVPLANIIDPHAIILSLRGKILENGMPRFFTRLYEGFFDKQDLYFVLMNLQTLLKQIHDITNLKSKM